jgi:hypothetical protein
MFTAIVSDCRDDNAMARQAVRTASLLGKGYHIVPVRIPGDLGAALCLIDMLDAAEVEQGGGAVLVNVAPRNKLAGEEWPNGPPFCYFWYGQTVVVSSISGLTLSLVKKLKLAREVKLLDIPTVAAAAGWSADVQQRTAETQFRSFEFLPRVVAILLAGQEVPAENYSLAAVPSAPKVVYFVDSFGNCKTPLLPGEVGFREGLIVETRFGNLSCHRQLCSVPDGESAIVIGSSGIGNARFLEIVVQGGNAAQCFGASVGTPIFESPES